MDAFWCITLSIVVIRMWWKHQPGQPWFPRKKKIAPVNFPPSKTPAELQRERDAEDLRKQGYTDDVIAIILPTISTGS